MSDEQVARLPEPAESSDKSLVESLDASGEVVLALQPEGLLVGGDPAAVASYIDRIRGVVQNGLAVAALDEAAVGNIAALATGAAALIAQAGQFVQLHPDSVQAVRAGNLIPGTDGFFRMVTRGADGGFLKQLQWRPVDLGPTQLASVQTMAVQLALKAAIAEVNESIKRVEGKVDSVLKLAEAQRIGDVLGRHATLERLVAYFEKHKSIPTSYWESVAALGPELDVTVEQLRAHVSRTVQGFDEALPVHKRADIVKRAVESDRLGETLSLLVIAEEGLNKWHRLHIARVQATEPDHLPEVVSEVSDVLAHQLRRDAALYARTKDALDAVTKVSAIDGFRRAAVRDLERNRSKLGTDLDAFAAARRHQIARWGDFSAPSVLDAAAAVVEIASNTADRALAAVGDRFIKIGEYLTEERRQKDAADREGPDAT